MADIAVIADRITAELFSFTDFDIKSINEKDDLNYVLDQFYQKKYEVIYITETLSDKVKEKIIELQKKGGTIIVSIPGIDSNQNHNSQIKIKQE